MGTLCGCTDIRRRVDVKGAIGIRPEDLEDEPDLGASSKDSRSEVALESDVGESEDDSSKKDVSRALDDTAKLLQQGKTLAVKEAISAAQRCGVDRNKLKQAEALLEEHVAQQARGETELKVSRWMGSRAAWDLEACQRLLEDVSSKQCSEKVLAKLRAHLEKLQITRPLSDAEVEQAKAYVTSSCKEFVAEARSAKGRPTLFLHVTAGHKAPAFLFLNPPLQVLSLKVQQVGEHGARGFQKDQETLLRSVNARPAKDEKGISEQRGFLELEHGEVEHCVAMRCRVNGKERMWCFVEASVTQRDRLIQALLVLSSLPPIHEPEDG